MTKYFQKEANERNGNEKKKKTQQNVFETDAANECVCFSCGVAIPHTTLLRESIYKYIVLLRLRALVSRSPPADWLIFNINTFNERIFFSSF